jgi:predicted DCC family thiol-disulfide oxidoreductase YuxK
VIPALTLLIDGQCPLCQREAAFLQRLDAGRGRLAIVDITAPDFDPARYDASRDALLGKIHGVLADGRVVTGMEVFRLAYRAVGWGWLLAPTGWPVLRSVCDAVYRWFARNRFRMTRRSGACATNCSAERTH